MSTNEEWDGVHRRPRTPNVIEGFPYPKPVQALIKKMEQAYEIWAEADTAVSVAEEDLELAKSLDAKEFAESILAGEEDPGEVHTPKALRKLQGARILANARLVEVNKIGRTLSDALRDNMRDIAFETLTLAREGLAERDRLMLEAARLVSEAHEARNRGLAGLRELSSYTRGTFQFDPTFYTQAVNFPSFRDERVNQILDQLEKMLNQNVLFPEENDEPEVMEATA